jgi:hypothetical protein
LEYDTLWWGVKGLHVVAASVDAGALAASRAKSK